MTDSDQQELDRLRLKGDAETAVDRYLAEKWATYRWALVAASIVATLLGVQGWLSWDALEKQRKELQAKQAELLTEVEQVKAQAAAAQGLLKDAERIQGDAVSRLVSVMALMQANAETVTRSNSAILASQENASGLLTRLNETTSKANEEYEKARNDLKGLEQTQAAVKARVEAYLKDKLAEKAERVQALERLNEDLQEATQALLKLRASDTILLRTHGQAQIEIPDVCDGAGARTFKLSFSLKDNIRNDFKVSFSARPPSGPSVEDEIAVNGSMKRGTRNPTGQLPGTPFDFEAFVYHDRIAADFAVLKIRPRENYRCPESRGAS